MSRKAGVVGVVAVLALLGLGAGRLLALGAGFGSTASAAPVVEGPLDRPGLIARGRYLATIGGCVACHTAQGGKPYAGGRMLSTPFGAIPSSNITPDPATGIGRWHFDDFWRAMHTGKGRRGERLYPAFPYTSYTKLRRDDVLAIFAYLRSLSPVNQPRKALGLSFPYSVRSSLLAWRALYFDEGVYQPDPGRSVAWNRGAYLVQGLGHCNECHAPRNRFGAIPRHPRLSGGLIPVLDWYAPNLSAQPGGGLQGWSTQDIVDLLKTGRSARGSVFGPMSDVVVRSTQYMRDDDLRAVATYLHSLPSPPQAPSALPASAGQPRLKQGREIYRQRCASCHGKRGQGIAGVYPPLDGNASVTEPTGINAIRSVLLGGFAPVTQANPRPYSMPPFAQQLDDAEVAAVVSYLRQAWSNNSGAVEAGDVARYRQTPVD
ncbi:MAG: cytochrome c [Rhodanobacter sp.]|nr:MAG: cytochrome c [Rhodanobacter sp.]